jgi:hypothetical protein
MSNIFQIQNEYLQLIDKLIQNEGELTPELDIELAINKEELQAKAINYGFVVKQLDAEVDIIDLEIGRLQGLKKVRNNAIERLKTNLKNAMELYEMTEIKSPIIKINFRKSESVEFTNLVDVPEDYFTIKVEKIPNKIAIKDAIKSGIEVPGACISINQNIQIK